ncbi:MAG: malate dehydrogenase [Bacteroidia bacterium]|nr:malate dehydrogenase [Bacteroidia bacterium]MCX7764019.1 malate dehydrogenase [Bacteroidia bacterium]MDW8058314.1 malate dehydrogenase [Bacteroidia bacterium]
MTKVSIIGAGNVGATAADIIARSGYCHEVVLLDIKPGLAEGKALDIAQTSPLLGFDTKVRGVTNDYKAIADSDVVIITSGRPRSPGMSRDDLVHVNAEIIKSVIEPAVFYAPNAIFIIVTNPLDTMAYYAYKLSRLPSQRVIGMAGVLDTARYRYFLAQELGASVQDIEAMLLGGHGDTMVPLPRYTTISGIPVINLLSEDKLNAIVERTKFGGGEITKLIGTSAWYAPGAAIAQMVASILLDQKRILPCSVYLQGQYDLHDIYIGVPVKLGRNGVEEIIQLALTDAEKKLLHTSAEAVRSMNAVLKF